MSKTVKISIEGGVIQEVDCPAGVQLIVKDYDVDGTEPNLAEDDTGDEFVETIWR
jgi:hypothetical protein